MIEVLEAELMKHLERLSVDIGPRPIGSSGDHLAADYIQDEFQAAGLEVEKQRFECPSWDCEHTELELDGKRMEAVANAFSPHCDVSAPTVAVGTVAQLETAELEGRIGILYGDLTKAPLDPKSWFLKSQRDEYVVRLLEEKMPAALITVQPRPGDLERVIVDWEFPIPSATVPAHTGLALLRKSEPNVRLRIISHRSPGHTCNIVARKTGSTASRIVLCAHYDTTVDTPGAADNGSGVAMMLTLAQLLSSPDNTLGLECIAFSGHEYLPLGDDEYLRRHGDQLEQIVAVINFDGAGSYVGSNSITMMTHSRRFREQVGALTKRYPGVVWVDPWPQSNHSTFANRGVPSLAFSRVGGARHDHLRSDTVEWISPTRLREIVLLVKDIVESLHEKPLDWTRQG